MYCKTIFFFCYWCYSCINYSSRCRKDLSERIKLIKSDDKIRDEKVQYDINREAAKILVLSSGKTVKYEYLTGEETLSFDQSRIIEQAKF